VIDAHEPVPQLSKRLSINPFIKIQGYPGSLGGHFGSGGEVLSFIIVSMMDESWQNPQKNKSRAQNAHFVSAAAELAEVILP
jgi:hypothetical protein